MITKIPQVQAPAVYTSMMGSLYGAIHTWDDTLTLTDIFGYSGHAFILNIERSLCPSGPTGWDWGAILFPLRQMVSLRRLCATCDMRDALEARELIWQRTVESIDAGKPAVIWDALLPEFYLAYGYDDEAGEYLVQGPGTERVSGRIPWERLGYHTGQVWGLFPSPHDSPDRETARNLALRGVVSWHKWASNIDSQWTFGGDAWNVWIAAMKEEEVAQEARTIAFTHHVYAECRAHAADFLTAQGPRFSTAADAYRRVAGELKALCEAWPPTAQLPSHDERIELARHLEAARDAEREGVMALEAEVVREPALRA